MYKLYTKSKKTKNKRYSILKPSLAHFSIYDHQGLPPVTQTSLSSMSCKNTDTDLLACMETGHKQMPPLG